jgi:hypothetical protein
MFWRDKRGNVAIIMALSFPVAVAGAGFGVEVGFWRYDQVRLQQAADAAAYAGAVVKRAGGTNITDAATAAATSNGYTSATDTIVVNMPSTVTPGDPHSVEAVISRTEAPFFTAIFSKSTTVVRSSGTASYKDASDACILALDHSASKAAQFAGNSTLSLTACQVMSDSISPSALYVNGSAVVTAPCMSTVGGASLGGTVTLTSSSCTAVQTSQPPVADPYSGLTMPTPAALGYSKNCKNAPTPKGKSTSVVIPPDHYCGFNFNNGITYTFQAGTFIIDGDVTFNAGAVVNDDQQGGVTLDLAGGALKMNGSAVVTLAAPTSGTYKGMLIISNPTNTNSLTINGDSSSLMTGTIYAPSGQVSYIGNFSGASGCTQIVADTVSWSGNTTFNDDCTNYGMTSVKVGAAVKLSA